MTCRSLKRWQQGSGRYYEVYLSKDLFGNWVLTCVWGGIQSKIGNFKHYPFASFQEAKNALKRIGNKRKTRGYT